MASKVLGLYDVSWTFVSLLFQLELWDNSYLIVLGEFEMIYMKYLIECLPWGRFFKMGEVNLLFSKTSGSDGDDMC